MPDGYRIIRLDRCDTTNEEARRQAEVGEASGLWIVAEEQTLGRGRRGRGWESPPGNLYASLLLRPRQSTAVAAQLSFVAALAVRDLAAAYLGSGHSIRCKWPNDVLLDGRKFSGILLESVAGTKGSPEWVVLGVGINVAWKPEQAEYPVAALVDFCDPPPSVGAVFSILAARFDDWWRRWDEEGFMPLRESWLESAYRLGESIEARLPTRRLEGRFAGLDEAGSLLLETESGAQHVIQAADIFPTFGEAS